MQGAGDRGLHGRLAPSNAALVERAVRITRDLGSEVASPDEARAIIGLKRAGPN